MKDGDSIVDLDKRYYVELAAAFARGILPDTTAASDIEMIQRGLRSGLRMHSFKRTADLPRVRRILGILRGLAPESLVDIGSGRGVFLWPLLDAFPSLSVIAVERNRQRVAALQAVAIGGITGLNPAVMDAGRLGLAEHCVDVVTFLEVLEHLPNPARAASEALRVARRFVVLSVPSKEDNNPEHIHMFTRQSLEKLLLTAGARRVSFEGVLNHLIAIARV